MLPGPLPSSHSFLLYSKWSKHGGQWEGLGTLKPACVSNWITFGLNSPVFGVAVSFNGKIVRDLRVALFPGLPCLWVYCLYYKQSKTGGGKGLGMRLTRGVSASTRKASSCLLPFQSLGLLRLLGASLLLTSAGSNTLACMIPRWTYGVLKMLVRPVQMLFSVYKC